MTIVKYLSQKYALVSVVVWVIATAIHVAGFIYLTPPFKGNETWAWIVIYYVMYTIAISAVHIGLFLNIIVFGLPIILYEDYALFKETYQAEVKGGVKASVSDYDVDNADTGKAVLKLYNTLFNSPSIDRYLLSIEYDFRPRKKLRDFQTIVNMEVANLVKEKDLLKALSTLLMGLSFEGVSLDMLRSRHVGIQMANFKPSKEISHTITIEPSNADDIMTFIKRFKSPESLSRNLLYGLLLNDMVFLYLVVIKQIFVYDYRRPLEQYNSIEQRLSSKAYFVVHIRDNEIGGKDVLFERTLYSDIETYYKAHLKSLRFKSIPKIFLRYGRLKGADYRLYQARNGIPLGKSMYSTPVPDTFQNGDPYIYLYLDFPYYSNFTDISHSYILELSLYDLLYMLHDKDEKKTKLLLMFAFYRNLS